MAKLSLKGVRKNFKDVEVLRGIDLDIEDRELIVFVGPSGCGKSTLLRLIAGLDEMTAGEYTLHGRSMIGVPPSRRDIAMVFQSYALYPHMSVYENMAFGVKLMGLPKDEIKARIAETAEMLKLEPLLNRKPRELSGGQRQRVAIGRALVRKPSVFLLDEPLSNLDAALRSDVRLEIARLHHEIGGTMIYVTHDQVEAMTLADRIVVMNGGVIEQVGSPRELFERPANTFVATFIGSPKMTLLEVEHANGRLHIAGTGSVPASAGLSDGPLTIGIRPDSFELTQGAPMNETGFEGRVIYTEYLGDESFCYIALNNGAQLATRIDPNLDLAPDTIVSITPKAGLVHHFDRQTGLRLPDVG